MYKNATKCNETIGKWCKTKHGASKIIDTFETYQAQGQKTLHLNTTSLSLDKHAQPEQNNHFPS
jgi:hypothetical protein